MYLGFEREIMIDYEYIRRRQKSTTSINDISTEKSPSVYQSISQLVNQLRSVD